MFGAKLKTIRREKRMSQGDLADKAKINRSYLSMIENGHSSPTIDVVQRLADGLSINLWQLLADVEESHFLYDLDGGFEMYEALHELLNDKADMMLIQPSMNEIEMLKGVRFSGGFKPDKRFYLDALLAYRRSVKSDTTVSEDETSVSSED
jgi:transcriptional regulator with XRE-family HTH domain